MKALVEVIDFAVIPTVAFIAGVSLMAVIYLVAPLFL